MQLFGGRTWQRIGRKNRPRVILRTVYAVGVRRQRPGAGQAIEFQCERQKELAAAPAASPVLTRTLKT